MYAAKLGGRGDGDHTVEALIRALHEAKPEMDGHPTDVAELARDVSRRLGLASEELDVVVRAAKLHDVGKMAIPDEVLDKPGLLTEDEWQLIREHTIVGERIVSAAPALGQVAKLVRATHEHFDGAGYPDGLVGEQIPLEARIVHTADAFCAMTQQRPYRAAKSVEGALDELRRRAGSQFDPKVSEALIAVVREGAFARTSADGVAVDRQ
jgi:two-component system, cell cycle response regulator